MKIRKNFRLSPEVVAKMEREAKEMKITSTQYVEMCVKSKKISKKV